LKLRVLIQKKTLFLEVGGEEGGAHEKSTRPPPYQNFLSQNTPRKKREKKEMIPGLAFSLKG
jgi:hypothetical protein